MDSFSVAGLDFQLVKADSVFIGEDKGGWIYASQRPKHEVKCPDFYIMAKPLTLEELSNLLSTELSPGDETTWNQERLSAITSNIVKRARPLPQSLPNSMYSSAMKI